MKMKKLFFLFILGFTSNVLYAQLGVLNQKINLDVQGMPLGQVLNEIEKNTGYKFSYNSSQLEVNKPVTYSSRGNTLENVLLDLLGPDIKGKVRGNHIILQKKNAQKKDFWVSGYVRDGETGEQMHNVSIYEPVTLASALSNSHGYYKIKLPKNQNDIGLYFSRENFDLTVAAIQKREDHSLNINLKPTGKRITAEVKEIDQRKPVLQAPEGLKKSTDSTMRLKEVPVPQASGKDKITLPRINLDEEIAFLDSTVRKGKDKFMQWLMTTRQNNHAQNIQDTLYRPFQISVLPFVGTNLGLGPLVTNDYSFNVIGGYTGNVRKLEVGTALNIVRRKMTGIQISGAVNVVGEEVKGVQIAGSSNFNLGNSAGLFLAGATNFTLGDADGLALAGTVNITGGKQRGAQIAPVNYAGNLIGVQIGVVNIAKETHGLPIGLISFAGKNGYRRFEVNTSELNLGEMSFKTGVPAFYNIFAVSYNFNRADKPNFGFGYGLGTAWSYNRWLGSELELVSQTYLPGFGDYRDIDLWDQHLKLSLGLEVRLGRSLALFAAPTANFFVTQTGRLNFADYPLLISERNLNWFENPAKAYTWIGYKAGIRLRNRS
jgi:hypothetical protein